MSPWGRLAFKMPDNNIVTAKILSQPKFPLTEQPALNCCPVPGNDLPWQRQSKVRGLIVSDHQPWSLISAFYISAISIGLHGAYAPIGGLRF